ncbi:MAG: ribonuclease P protein component [Sedimentisphaerales bacterium]|nr:ribonuclease P protein component [Sedimentisphaerales bacterium]
MLSNRQFKAVLGRNRRASDNLLTLFVAPNDCGSPRLGVSVGRKVCGKATVRNRLKRLVREAFRQNQERIPRGYDYVVMISPSFSNRIKQAENPKKAWAALTFDQVQKSFVRLVERVVAADHRDRPESPEQDQRSEIKDQN